MSKQPNYRIYATLLDSFMQYERAEAIWEKYYGFSQEPPYTPEEFREKLYHEFIDKINRVPFESEVADKGTAFNEIVDAIIERRSPNNMSVSRTADSQYEVKFKQWTFTFPMQLCIEMAEMYKGAICQHRVSAVMETWFGDVELYGIIDELMPMAVHDIKTTSSYSVGKFRYNNQHLIYPWALAKNGTDTPVFNYDVVEFGKGGKIERYQESYVFDMERDEPILRERVESLVLFLKNNKHLITDRKIFGL